MSDPEIRPLRWDDLDTLRQVLEATELFPPEMLADMAEPWFTDPAQASWFVAEAAGGVAGFCHARPEPLTEGTWNMLALAVHPAAQGRGVAAALLAAGEAALRALGARLCLVDTADTAEFATARRLYERAGYDPEARIGDYWAQDVAKVTYVKRL